MKKKTKYPLSNLELWIRSVDMKNGMDS
jgi:hypothetical protein